MPIMKLLRLAVLALSVYHGVTARDSFEATFVKHFIFNEEKPIQLILGDLCWRMNFKVKLAKDLFKTGLRTSKSLSYSLDHVHHNLLFLVDLTCPNSNDVLLNAETRKLFVSPFRWLVLSNSSNVNQNGLNILWNCSLLPDSYVVLAESNGHKFNMIELHRTNLSAPMISIPRGYFNGTFYDTRPHRELFRRRWDLMGHPLTMTNVIQDSNSTQFHLPREDRLELQFDSTPKICWMAAKLVFEKLNATPRYIFSHRWGYKANGEWSGMINDLYTGKADLGTNCITSNTARLQVVTYTDMVSPFRVRFVFRQPPLSYVSNIFSLPFSTSVWLAIFVCAAVSTTTLLFASKWEASLSTSPQQLDGSIGDAFLLTMSAVGQQGCYLEPRKFSGRVMTWVIFAALMLLYAAYSANIVVLLQAPSNSIRTLAQLADSKIVLAAHEVDSSHFIFNLHKGPAREKIYKRVDPENGKGQFYDVNDGVERIRQGLFAFHGMVEPMYRRVEQTFLEIEKCDLTEIDFMNAFDPFIPVKKGSPYLELFKVTFKQVREVGIQSALLKRMLVPKPRCDNKVSAFSSVGLLDLKPVLLFMVYGIITSVFIAVLEILTFKLHKRRPHQLRCKTKLSQE